MIEEAINRIVEQAVERALAGLRLPAAEVSALMDTQAVATYLRVPPARLRHARDRREPGPTFVKWGSCVLYSREALDDFVRSLPTGGGW